MELCPVVLGLSPETPVKPDSDWVLVCVRSEQLADARREIALQLGAARAVAIATLTLDGALSAARAAGLTGSVLACRRGSRASLASQIG
jgi:hypothetical protein